MGNTAFDPNHILVAGTGGSNGTADGRLTLVSNTPVMLNEVKNASTLYYTPYTGNKLSLYNGATWEVFTFIEPNLSLAGLTADTLYDVFAYDNAGIVTLEALIWSNSNAGISSRTTALAYQDGVLVKSTEATRRYLGTFRTTIESETEFSFGGTSNDGTEAKLYLWNCYNRVLTKSFSGSSRVAWTYTGAGTGSFRAAIGSNTMRISFVVGLQEESISADYNISAHVPEFDTSAMCGIGLNTTNNVSGIFSGNSTNARTIYGSLPVGINAKCNTAPPSGFNFLQALDGANQANTVTFQCKDTNWGVEGPGLTLIGMF